MLTVLRHLTPILLMPFVAVVGVPYWLLSAFAAHDHRWGGGGFIPELFRILGAFTLITGLALFAWCVMLFARVGQGTLAPWDPTSKLVVVGPYRYARNPMISGVSMMLLGETLFSGSWVVGIWFGAFLCVNHLYFVLSEEPGLEKRFGESYRQYKKNVPRWALGCAYKNGRVLCSAEKDVHKIV
jgi:protein-S-isoprenylcysteine O-methyltransferase Ste14